MSFPFLNLVLAAQFLYNNMTETGGDVRAAAEAFAFPYMHYITSMYTRAGLR